MAGAFRYKVWDPPLIIGQIVTVQALYYLSLGMWVALMGLMSGHHRSLDSIFDYTELQLANRHGRFLMAGFILNALTSAAAVWRVVRRTKQCLDFSATCTFLHLLTCWLYVGHLPVLASYYLLHLLCLALSCVLAEYLCLSTEMAHIPVRGREELVQ